MIYLFWMLGYGFLELQFCDIVHIHLPMNSACLIFQSEVESGGKKAWKQEAGCKWTSTYWSHPPSSSSKEANYYLPNSTNFLNLVIQKTVLLYLCEYTCVEFVWVNSATYVKCKEMKQDCQLEKILIDYIVNNYIFCYRTLLFCNLLLFSLEEKQAELYKTNCKPIQIQYMHLKH